MPSLPFSGRATSWPSTRSSTLTSVISLGAWSAGGGRASRKNVHSCASSVIFESRNTRGLRSLVWRWRNSSYLARNLSPHDENSANFLLAVWALTYNETKPKINLRNFQSSVVFNSLPSVSIVWSRDYRVYKPWLGMTENFMLFSIILELVQIVFIVDAVFLANMLKNLVV